LDQVYDRIDSTLPKHDYASSEQESVVMLKRMIVVGLFFASVGLSSSAVAADSAATSVTGAVMANSYGQGYTRSDERNAVLQRLNEVCKSTLASDHMRCQSAWKMIRTAKAQLDTEKAATH
jgi:hypothetical protein